MFNRTMVFILFIKLKLAQVDVKHDLKSSHVEIRCSLNLRKALGIARHIKYNPPKAMVTII